MKENIKVKCLQKCKRIIAKEEIRLGQLSEGCEHPKWFFKKWRRIYSVGLRASMVPGLKVKNSRTFQIRDWWPLCGLSSSTFNPFIENQQQ